MKIPLERLNSLTKYPSTPTLHEMDGKGKLTESFNVVFPGPVMVTEKIDGTNCRIIFPSPTLLDPRCPGWIIGSRKELLGARPDLIRSGNHGIVSALENLADSILPAFKTNKTLVVYGELFGGRIQKACKQYSSDRDKTGFRVFDIMEASDETLVEWSQMPKDIFGLERDKEGLTRMSFLGEKGLELSGLELVPRTRMQSFKSTDIKTTSEWLKRYSESSVKLDDEAGGKSEGVVIRTLDGVTSAKLRFEDYKKALK